MGLHGWIPCLDEGSGRRKWSQTVFPTERTGQNVMARRFQYWDVLNLFRPDLERQALAVCPSSQTLFLAECTQERISQNGSVGWGSSPGTWGGGWRAAPSAVVQPLQLHAGVRDVRVDEVEARQLHRDGPASGVYGCQVGGCLPRPRMGVGWWLTAPRPPKGFGDSRTALPGPPPGASPPCRGPPAGNKLPERRVVRILQI